MSKFSNKVVGEGLTYDDVLLIPAFSQILPREVSTHSKFSRNIPLYAPVVSAAMDTAETQKDRANIKSVIYSAGRKYKVDAAVVQRAAKAAEKMYAKPAVKKAVAKKAAVKRTVTKKAGKK